MPFKFERLEITDLILIKPKVFEDGRGFFMETYKKSDFKQFDIDTDFVQDNHSSSSKGVLRGLHYQLKPKAQGKLVRCVNGKIFDVAVDIRKSSPSFGKWIGAELSEENRLMLWIPKGFAHGFLTLSEKAQMVYKVSGNEYSIEYDRNIRWNDPDIGIDWPIGNPILSEKDEKAPFLKDTDNNFIYKGSFE